MAGPRPRRFERYRRPWRAEGEPGAPETDAGPTLFAFDWGEPGGPDLNDSTPLVLGVMFSVTQATQCYGVEWRAPDTPVDADVTFTVWNAGTQARLATVTQTVATSGLVRALFAEPVDLAAETDYMASIHTPDGYVGTFPYDWPETQGILVADADNGWFVGWPEEVFPNNESGSAANYHVSPLVAG